MEKKRGLFAQSIRGGFMATTCMLVFVLLFAVVVKIATINTTAVKVVNQFIKIIAIFTACVFCVKEDRGLIKGALIGSLSGAFIHIIFAIIGAGVGFNASLFLDVLFTSVVGIISGILVVNVRK